MPILNLEKYRIPHRHMLFCQTSKKPLSNFEPQKLLKYKQLWGLSPDPSCLYKKVYLFILDMEMQCNNSSTRILRLIYIVCAIGKNDFLTHLLICDATNCKQLLLSQKYYHKMFHLRFFPVSFGKSFLITSYWKISRLSER